nr:hypothetical protein [Tanacetum cinerariifolium]
MILESVEHGPLIWPTVEENSVIRTTKYVELSTAEKIQVDCDMQATNIILQGLPVDIYSLVNHHRVAKDLRERVQLLMQDSSFAVPVFSLGYDLIACLNKAMAFLTAIASSRNSSKSSSKNIPHNAAFQTKDLDTYDSDYDDLSNAHAVLMANISNYDSDVISETAQRMKPTLYDGIVMSEKHVSMPVIDDDETLILEEESRSKMSKKAKDPEVIAKKISHKPIDYEKLNRLTDILENVLLHNKNCRLNKLSGYVYPILPLNLLYHLLEFKFLGNYLRFTSTNVVPPKQPTSHSDEIQRPKIKVYCKKPKNVKHIGLSKIAKIVESKNANHSEPNHTWGSIATDILLSSSLVIIGCPACTLHRFIMDDPNITIEEYIRLKDEKARRQGRTFNWQTATNGKMEYYEDDSFTNLEIEYPAIVFDGISDTALSCEPMVSPLDNNEIDFNISFEESDDKEYMVIFGKNSCSCKIISVDNLKTDSEDENDKVNMPSSLSPEPIFGYIDDLDFFKDFENEFPAIAYNDLKSKSDPLMNLLIYRRGQAPKMVTGVDLFYLRSMDSRTTNIPYLLAITYLGMLRGGRASTSATTTRSSAPDYVTEDQEDLGGGAQVTRECCSGRTYQAFDSTFVGSSRVPYQRCFRPMTGDASTSKAPHTNDQPDP